MANRKSHIYCIGTAKSGTHTLADIWGDNYKTAHEPEAEFMINLILNYKNGIIDDNVVIKNLISIDNKLKLDINSSQLNFFFIDILTKIFQDSKYILTIRDPISWLDSLINHQLSSSCSSNWKRLRDFRFNPSHLIHPNEEKALKKNNLYTLDGYLSYWNYHNKKAITVIPTNKLLILRTDKINESTKVLSDFVNLFNYNIMNSNVHSFKAKNKFNILAQINKDYLYSKVKEHCIELLIEFFPEIDI